MGERGSGGGREGERGRWERIFPCPSPHTGNQKSLFEDVQQYTSQMTKRHSATQKTKIELNGITLKNGGESRCSVRISSSCAINLSTTIIRSLYNVSNI